MKFLSNIWTGHSDGSFTASTSSEEVKIEINSAEIVARIEEIRRHLDGQIAEQIAEKPLPLPKDLVADLEQSPSRLDEVLNGAISVPSGGVVQAFNFQTFATTMSSWVFDEATTTSIEMTRRME